MNQKDDACRISIFDLKLRILARIIYTTNYRKDFVIEYGKIVKPYAVTL